MHFDLSEWYNCTRAIDYRKGEGMVTFRKLSLEESVLAELQDISRKASAKENRSVTLSEIVGIGLTHARMIFHLENEGTSDNA